MRRIGLRAILICLLLGGGLELRGGAVLRLFYDDTGSGTAVSNLTSASIFPDGPTYESLATDALSFHPDNPLTDYGTYTRGYITAPTTGDYVFFVSSDDGAEFWLSTDDSPANKKLVAFETGCCTPLFSGARLADRSSDPIHLEQGKQYYFEALNKQGGGGEYLDVGWQKPDGTQELVPGTVLMPFPLDLTTFQPKSNEAPTILASLGGDPYTGQQYDIPNAGQPASTNVVENQPVWLVVTVEATPPVTFQWKKNGQDISGADLPFYYIPRAQLADDGASYTVEVKNSVGTVTSQAATVSVAADTEPPTVVSAGTLGNPNAVTVTFSEDVDPATATNTSNYSLDNGVTVQSAALGASQDTVVLTTSTISDGTTTHLTVKDVQDLAATPNKVSPNPTTILVSPAQGVIFDDIFHLASGDLASFTNNPAFPDNWGERYARTSFEGPGEAQDEFGDNYESHFQGYVFPPETGDYIFYICSDDQSMLFLSTDEDPANKVMIAEEPQWNNPRQWVATSRRDANNPENRSAPIHMEAGKKYYIEAIHREGGGGDNIGVTWQLPGAQPPANGDPPLPGKYLSTLIPSGPITIATAPADQSADERGDATFKVTAAGTPPYTYQWQRDGQDITGETNPSLTLTGVKPSDSGAKFTVKVSNKFSSATSSAATLTVVPDTTPPFPIWATKDGALDSLSIRFSEVLDKTSAQTAGNYTVSPGNVTVSQAVLSESGTVVDLAVSGLQANTDYTIQISGVTDVAETPNPVAANTQIKVQSQPESYSDVILQDKPIAFYRFEETSGSTAKNDGTTGAAGDGLYMVGEGPGSPGSASGDPGPRPPEFLGFSPNNHAATFDGTSTWVDTQNQFLQDRQAFTLEYWVKPSGRSSFPTRVGIVGQNDAVEYGFIDPNDIQIWTPNGGSLNTTYSFPDDEWHHVATIADGQTIKTYYDGKLIASGGSATSDYGSSTFNVHIGGGGVFDATGNFFAGQIDEVAIFDKAIPASRIAAHYEAGKEGAVPSLPSVSISSPADLSAFGKGADVPLTADVQDPVGLGATVQFFANGNQVGEVSSSPYTFTWSSPPSGIYTLQAKVTDKIGGTGSSGTITIAVDRPLRVVGVGSLDGGSTLGVTFSEDLDQATAENASNYSIPGATITAAQLDPEDPRQVLLTATGVPNDIQITVNGVKDKFGNTANNATSTGTTSTLTADTLGTPIEPGSATFNGFGVDVTAGGDDIWGNADNGFFVYTQWTGNFDAHVQIIRLDHDSSAWTKAGLDMREEGPANNDSRHADVILASGQGASGLFDSQYRETKAGASAVWPGSDRATKGTDPRLPNAWVRLTRKQTPAGDVMTDYRSYDGVNWTQMDQMTLTPSYPDQVYVGMVTTAHNDTAGTTTIAQYRNFAITDLAPAPVNVTLSASIQNGKLQLSWAPNQGTLQSAAAVTGPWSDVSGATNPMSVATDSAQQFYRVKVSP